MRKLVTLMLTAAAAAALAAGVARASTAISPGDGWHSFSFTGTTANPGPQPFTFTTTKPVTLAVTDVLCPGDDYTVYDNGVVIGVTSAPDAGPDCSYADSTPDPAIAMDDPVYSSGWVTLPPGTHSITIAVAYSPYPASGGYIRIDSTRVDPAALGGGQNVALAAKGGGLRYPTAKKFH